MGNQISDLYNQVINEHRKYPRNKGLVPGYKTLHLKNPSCGDDVTVQVEIKDGKIYNEIRKGNDTRKEFFDKIIDVVTLLGGDINDAL